MDGFANKGEGTEETSVFLSAYLIRLNPKIQCVTANTIKVLKTITQNYCDSQMSISPCLDGFEFEYKFGKTIAIVRRVFLPVSIGLSLNTSSAKLLR